MSASAAVHVGLELHPAIFNQPAHVLELDTEQRDALIVAMRKVDSSWVVVSRYGDDVWWLSCAATNVTKASTKLTFAIVSELFRNVTKAMMYRLLRRGRTGQVRPGRSMLVGTLKHIANFLQYLTSLGIFHLSDINTLTCSNYVQSVKALRAGQGRRVKLPDGSGHPFTPEYLVKIFGAVEIIYELSQFTTDPMSQHPWPETSARHLAGKTRSTRATETKTPLMPDEVFATLFKKAWGIVETADHLIGLRAEMNKIDVAGEEISRQGRADRKVMALQKLGWKGGHAKLRTDLLELRTACYVVIAVLSGCRNHELAFLHTNSYYSTEDDEGGRHWWMRSKSTKTGEGDTEWMIPEAAVVALKVMDRWAEPYQVLLQQEIEAYRNIDRADTRIAEAQAHLGAIFVGNYSNKGNQLRTVALGAMNNYLKAFAKSCGLEWVLSSHQFRRKFANYAARSQFGDLRYLKEHFKHWSMDMTLGYALNDSQEMVLYLDIQDEIDEVKEGVVATWLNDAEPLAGGYGNNLVSWRSKTENITLFKNHDQMIRSIAQSTAIRSNGHAWCTADDNQCVGNNLERTRCGAGCSNAVIGSRYAPFYQGLYDQLKQLEHCDDIGEGGRARVQRDLDRCATVLTSLGHDPRSTVI